VARLTSCLSLTLGTGFKGLLIVASSTRVSFVRSPPVPQEARLRHLGVALEAFRTCAGVGGDPLRLTPGETPGYVTVLSFTLQRCRSGPGVIGDLLRIDLCPSLDPARLREGPLQDPVGKSADTRA
jgi:hypothetical protein